MLMLIIFKTKTNIGKQKNEKAMNARDIKWMEMVLGDDDDDDDVDNNDWRTASEQ